jgi:hypothetical protein
MALMMAEAGAFSDDDSELLVVYERLFATRLARGLPMDNNSPVDGLTTSLNAVAEITKAMKDVGDASEIPTKIYELAKEIMTAQSCALAVQAEQFDLAQSKRNLEEEILRLKAWNTERYRYQLQSVGPGANAYVVKHTMRGSEPVHWICADCFQNGKKRFLNESHSDVHHVYHKCAECSYRIRIRKPSSTLGQAIVTDLSLESTQLENTTISPN